MASCWCCKWTHVGVEVHAVVVRGKGGHEKRPTPSERLCGTWETDRARTQAQGQRLRLTRPPTRAQEASTRPRPRIAISSGERGWVRPFRR